MTNQIKDYDDDNINPMTRLQLKLLTGQIEAPDFFVGVRFRLVVMLMEVLLLLRRLQIAQSVRHSTCIPAIFIHLINNSFLV
jgi:hypothetical protein